MDANSFVSVKLWRQTKSCTNTFEGPKKDFRDRGFSAADGNRKHKKLFTLKVFSVQRDLDNQRTTRRTNAYILYRSAATKPANIANCACTLYNDVCSPSLPCNMRKDDVREFDLGRLLQGHRNNKTTTSIELVTQPEWLFRTQYSWNVHRRAIGWYTSHVACSKRPITMHAPVWRHYLDLPATTKHISRDEYCTENKLADKTSAFSQVRLHICNNYKLKKAAYMRGLVA